ncbi:MAG: nitrilase family protein [Chitinophagaceae bacterium]|nr:nitrilase family protein [Chitinophagaceae bacterium]
MSHLSITLIQTDLFWEDKAANLSMLEKKIAAIEEKTHCVILPEMFSTGFSMRPENLAETMEGNSIQWMKKIAAEHRIILTGSLIIRENNHYFNRLVWMLPTAEMATYDKRHLFAFSGEDKYYTPGKKRLVASVNGWKINLQICYDLRFPVWARQSSVPQNEAEYDVLVYVANWPEKRSQAWKILLQARAIENQCYVVGVNRVGYDGNGIYHSGDSMVVDPLGEILYHKKDEEDVFTVTLHKEHLINIRQKFPFLKDDDRFVILDE